MNSCNNFALKREKSNGSRNPGLPLTALNHVNLLRIFLKKLDGSLCYCHLEIVRLVCKLLQKNMDQLIVSHIHVTDTFYVLLVEQVNIVSNWIDILNMSSTFDLFQLCSPVLHWNPEKGFFVFFSKWSICLVKLHTQWSKIFKCKPLLSWHLSHTCNH